MKRTIIVTAAAAAVVGSIALPSIVLGNARRTDPDGSLAAMRQAETPYIAELLGENEVPGPGDDDGSGVATVSFAEVDATTTQVCWDIAYQDISTVTAGHIHPGAAGESNPPLIDFGTPPASPGEWSGCTDALTTDVAPILADPSAYYVNIHTDDFAAGAIRGQLAAGPEPAGTPHFLPTPLRAFDSRIAPATKLASGGEQTVSLATGKDQSDADVTAVPPGATAAIVTLTATETDGPGFLTIFSADSPTPPTSNLNWVVAGDTVAVTTQVAVDGSGNVKVFAGAAGTHFLIDVIGYLY